MALCTERNLAPAYAAIANVMRHLCVLVPVLFFIGHMMFALVLGRTMMTNVIFQIKVFLSLKGLGMVRFGVAVGVGNALLVYGITGLALPMLLDREVDFVSAMIACIDYALANLVVVFSWALFIAVVTIVAKLPGLLGLLLPWLRHAIWHFYDQAKLRDSR